MKGRNSMKYSIVYSSRTGNTKLLAETIKTILPEQDCVYFGEPSEEASKADRIYVGFWTDKGNCNSECEEFLKKLGHKEVFLFGTAGFGGTPEYFDKIIRHVSKKLPFSAQIIGSYMCQGKMPISVRDRYEKMKKSPIPVPYINELIENFDHALTHPDQNDLERLAEEIKKLMTI